MPSTATSRLEGIVFHRLTVVGPAPSILQTNGKRKSAVYARCECGTVKAFVLTNLKSGNSKSCGCGKYAGMTRYNAERGTPQVWAIEGDVARIFIGQTEVLVDAADVPLVGRYRWHVTGTGYIAADGGKLWMHRLILGLRRDDPREADHKHHNTADNRRSEIRIATSSQNKMNQRGKSGGTSAFKGVFYDRARRRYTAQIKAAGRHRVIGRYRTELAAARAYDKAAAFHFGEFAYLNLAEAN